jgi:ribosome biogenesis protein YTM1
MSEEQVSSAAEAVQRQVRVQLSSQQEDIALPESTGPILVPTGKNCLQLNRSFALGTIC